MRKLRILCLVIMLAAFLCACGKDTEPDDDNTETVTPTVEPTEEATPTPSL